ncbi:MAG: DUF2905 domain-containing protein [Desulfobacteraceae bacterium]
MQKILIISGAGIVIIGLLWPWLHKIPFGRLPGDIVITRPGFSFFFPVTTMIIVSIIASVIWKLFK